MNPIIISVEGAGKRYRLGQSEQYQALRDVLARAMMAPARYVRDRLRPTGRSAERPDAGWFWALRDVSFEVRQGEILGLIGRNGAGKSTLLKLLSRVTKPTEGVARLRGRLGSLLEIGTGFHPELTGRENVFLNGAVLGMRRAEIARNFDEIVAFAGVEPFIDTPVKRYSTGMYLRLAFAVAAHLETDILLIDEVLAVGDAAFQRKCLGKMDDLAGQGRTIVFVSHNLVAVQDLCQRVIWLEAGRLAGAGRPESVIADYLQTACASQTERVWAEPADAPGDSHLRMAHVHVRPRDGAPDDEITVHSPLVIEIAYWRWDSEAYVHPSVYLHNERGLLICSAAPPFVPDWRERTFPTGLICCRCHIPGDLLNNGMHRIDLRISKNGQILMRDEQALTFDVHDSAQQRDGWYGEWEGAIRPMFEWQESVSLPAMAGSGNNGHAPLRVAG